jgi:hypothetical protein
MEKRTACACAAPLDRNCTGYTTLRQQDVFDSTGSHIMNAITGQEQGDPQRHTCRALQSRLSSLLCGNMSADALLLQVIPIHA